MRTKLSESLRKCVRFLKEKKSTFIKGKKIRT